MKYLVTLAAKKDVGHTRWELGDDSLRVVSIYRFLVIYDPTRRPLEILRVVHGARDLTRLPPM